MEKQQANWWQKLKERWEIESDLAAVIIFVVFGITGSTSVYVGDLIGEGLRSLFTMPSWAMTTSKVILVFIAYQFLLLIFGALFGQFRFFWAQEKKILKLLGRLVPFR